MLILRHWCVTRFLRQKDQQTWLLEKTLADVEE